MTNGAFAVLPENLGGRRDFSVGRLRLTACPYNGDLDDEYITWLNSKAFELAVYASP